MSRIICFMFASHIYLEQFNITINLEALLHFISGKNNVQHDYANIYWNQKLIKDLSPQVIKTFSFKRRLEHVIINKTYLLFYRNHS